MVYSAFRNQSPTLEREGANPGATADVELLGSRGHKHHNWAHTYGSTPELFFEPQNLKELRMILAAARVDNKRVKVVGFGHSPSDLAMTDGYMIKLTHFNKVLEIDSDTGRVRAQGGMLLRDFNAKIEKAGLAISSLGSISDVTLGGAIAVGYHGSGDKFACLSSKVTAVELLTADGDVLHLTRQDDGDRFLAVCLNLGALGVTLSLTLQCEPAFRLKQIQYPAKMDQVLENLDVHIKASEHFRFMWFCHTDYVMTYHASRSTQAKKGHTPGMRDWLWGVVVGIHLFQFLLWITTLVPGLIRPLCRLGLWLEGGRSERVDGSVRIFNFPCPLPFHTTEWAFPRDKTALVLYEMKTWIETNKFPAHFPIEVRFTAADDIPLSPAYGMDVCYINIISIKPYGKEVSRERFFNAFYDILRKAGGRPHWAKEHNLTWRELSKLYPRWDAFQKVRRELDPTDMFMNARLTRLLG